MRMRVIGEVGGRRQKKTSKKLEVRNGESRKCVRKEEKKKRMKRGMRRKRSEVEKEDDEEEPAGVLSHTCVGVARGGGAPSSSCWTLLL